MRRQRFAACSAQTALLPTSDRAGAEDAALWSIDFMSDVLYGGRRFRTFNVLDEGVREALAIEIDTSIPSERVVRLFEQLKQWRGLPRAIRCDNGPELIAQTLVDWCQAHAVELRHIQPGKPNQNAYIERFNRTFREEVLDQHLFARLEDVREAAYWWMLDYNEQRPHESLGDLTPAEYRQQAASGSTFEVSA